MLPNELGRRAAGALVSMAAALCGDDSESPGANRIDELPDSPYSLMAWKQLDNPDTTARLTWFSCQ